MLIQSTNVSQFQHCSVGQSQYTQTKLMYDTISHILLSILCISEVRIKHQDTRQSNSLHYRVETAETTVFKINKSTFSRRRAYAMRNHGVCCFVISKNQVTRCMAK